MKILFKRNSGSGSVMPSSANAGEPIWYKDRLYIGSVGATAGGTSGASAGALIPIATKVGGASELALSTTAQTYLSVDGTDYKIKMPSTDPYTSERIPSAHNQAWSTITSTPTTLSGYGITDAATSTHGHGNITNGGAITGNGVTIGSGDAIVVTDSSASGLIIKSAITFDAATTTKYLSQAGTWVDAPTLSSIGAASSTHTHGNITNGGALQTTDITIANGDKLVVTDSSDSSKIARTNVSFDGSTTSKYLSQKGTWVDIPSGTGSNIGGISIASQTASGSNIATGRVKFTPVTLSGHTLSNGTAVNTDLWLMRTPTQADPIATYSDISSVLASADAMVFKGTIGSSGATVTSLPNTHNAGWTYKVISAGTYAGKPCEVGDLIICIKDGTAANNDDWTVAQTNIDGAVTGPASAVSGRIAIFSGASGKVIADSGYTIATSVPANAVFTDTDTKVTSVDNHYSPSASSTAELSASASGATSAWSIDVVKGVQIQRDAKGHVTGVTVTSGKIPANPNTDITVKQTASTGNYSYPLLASSQSSPTSGTAYESIYNTGVTVNYSTKKITASGFIVTNGTSAGFLKADGSVDTNTYALSSAVPAAANNALLYAKKDSGTGVQIFSANESTNKTINFIAGTNVTLTENTGTTNTYKLTIGHTTPSGASTNSNGFYKFSTDSQGHVNGTTAVQKSDITALGIPGSDTNDTYTFSSTATTGTFTNTASGSVHTITLTEIDGGTF